MIKYLYTARSHFSKHLCAVILLGAMCLTVSTLILQAADLTIQAGTEGKAISPDLMGVFFEDLNYAADGGLYAEMIQNRSVEYSPVIQPEWHPLKFWELQKHGGGDGQISAANMRPIHPNNPQYAILTVETPGEVVGITNGGFDCIILKTGESYQASF